MNTIPALLEAIESDLEEIKRISEQKIQRNSNKVQLRIFEGNWIFNLITLIVYLLGFYIISQITFDPDGIINWLLLSGWSVTPVFGYLYGINAYTHFINLKIQKITSKVEKINKIHREIFEKIDFIQSSEEILTNIELIRNEILETLPLLKKQNLRIMKSYISKEIKVILLFLKNFKNDLLLEIKKNVDSLHEASLALSELKKNEIYHSSGDIQKTRLDTQIQQFEELEKVLQRT